jgi:hypothetical protein
MSLINGVQKLIDEALRFIDKAQRLVNEFLIVIHESYLYVLDNLSINNACRDVAMQRLYTPLGLTQLAHYFQFVVRTLVLSSLREATPTRRYANKIRAKALTTNYKSDFIVTLA